jgi:hypothetical protein
MWLKKYWLALLGVALQAETLWKFLKWILDWRGRYDALAATYHEVGGSGVAIGYILDPPAWFYPAAFLAGLILIWWNFHWNREQPHTSFPSDLAAAEIYQDNGRCPEASNAVRESTKTPVAQSAPTEAPVLQRSPEPVIQAPIAPSLAAIRSPPIPPKKPSRKFADTHVTPEFLVNLYQGNTALRAETLISEHIDEWMFVSGPLGEILPGLLIFNSSVRTPTLVVFATHTNPIVYMWFSGEWIDRLALLPKNQNISVLGKLKKVTGYNSKVELEDCELVDSGSAANSPAQPPNATTRPQRRRSSKGKPGRPSQG